VKKTREYRVVIGTSVANFEEVVIARSKEDATKKAFDKFFNPPRQISKEVEKEFGKDAFKIKQTMIKKSEYKKLHSTIDNHHRIFKFNCEGKEFFFETPKKGSFLILDEVKDDEDSTDRDF